MQEHQPQQLDPLDDLVRRGFFNIFKESFKETTKLTPAEMIELDKSLNHPLLIGYLKEAAHRCIIEYIRFNGTIKNSEDVIKVVSRTSYLKGALDLMEQLIKSAENHHA